MKSTSYARSLISNCAAAMLLSFFAIITTIVTK